MPSLPNEWRVTPSFRVAVFSHENKLGEEVLLDVDGKTKLCKHGETASTIRTWLHNEAKAAASGADPPPRNSACDCKRTIGVGSSVRTRPPTPPQSLYDLAAGAGGGGIEVGKRGIAFRVSASYNLYVSSDGSIFCEHGKPYSRHTGAKRPRVYRSSGECKCCLELPRRSPKHCLAWGRVGAKNCE